MAINWKTKNNFTGWHHCPCGGPDKEVPVQLKPDSKEVIFLGFNRTVTVPASGHQYSAIPNMIAIDVDQADYDYLIAPDASVPQPIARAMADDVERSRMGGYQARVGF